VVGTGKLERFDPFIPSEPWVNPWQADGSYRSDFGLLEQLLGVAVGVEARFDKPGARRALPAEAHVMSRAYSKQSDVVIASWAAGVEVLISTKTMLSSYQKNLGTDSKKATGMRRIFEGGIRWPRLGSVSSRARTYRHQPHIRHRHASQAHHRTGRLRLRLSASHRGRARRSGGQRTRRLSGRGGAGGSAATT